MNYVQQREAEVKAKFVIEMWWVRIVTIWEEIAQAMSAKRAADYYSERYNAIRAKYVRKGRPVGWRKAAA